MNEAHRAGCASEEWRSVVRDLIVPWVLADATLGSDVIELGPGYGASTDVVRTRTERMTAVEIAPDLAQLLTERLAGTNVEVVVGDATALEFEDGRFSSAVSFSMLHHIPSVELQDRMFREVRRVLMPGGVFLATDSLDSPDLRKFHEDDTFVPVDPGALPDRLGAAGFSRVEVERNDFAWKVTAA